MTTNNQRISALCLGFLLFTFFTSNQVKASDESISRNEYIEKWKDEAIRQMSLYNIPASITLAQGILESGNGNSSLAKDANNHFGIKCHEWDGARVYKDDDHKDDCFRKYESANESYRDHSIFLTTRKWYDFLFEYEISDYKSWAKGLKKAGYATNPKYADLLISIIEANDLSQYDKIPELLAVNEDKPKEEVLKENETPVKEDVLATEPIAAAVVNTHSIMVHSNKIKYVTVKAGDTYYKIAKEFNMGLWQLHKYNDLPSNDVLHTGDIIYLQPKKNKSATYSHIVKTGESMKSISQQYGVKLKKLYKFNTVEVGDQLQIGQKIYLQ